jgi:hypothetical protein
MRARREKGWAFAMPLLAILLSLFGLVPFVICGLAALGSDAAMADRMLTALIGYAAVTLGFIGGIHWGFELQSGQTDPVLQRNRLALGVAPPLIGWLALLLVAVVGYWAALLVLIAGYIATTLVEQQAARRALTPARYLWLRWCCTGVAVAMLVTVLTLRVLGQTISF